MEAWSVFTFAWLQGSAKGISLSLSLSLSLSIYIYKFDECNYYNGVYVFPHLPWGHYCSGGGACQTWNQCNSFPLHFTLKLCDLLTLSSLSYSTCLLFPYSDGDLSFMWEGPFMICTGSLSELMGPLGFTCFTRAPPPKSQDLSVCVNRGGQRWFSVLFVSLVHDSMVHTLSTKPMWIWWAFKESH